LWKIIAKITNLGRKKAGVSFDSMVSKKNSIGKRRGLLNLCLSYLRLHACNHFSMVKTLFNFKTSSRFF
jgi:hypothetical protein